MMPDHSHLLLNVLSDILSAATFIEQVLSVEAQVLPMLAPNLDRVRNLSPADFKQEREWIKRNRHEDRVREVAVAVVIVERASHSVCLPISYATAIRTNISSLVSESDEDRSAAFKQILEIVEKVGRNPESHRYALAVVAEDSMDSGVDLGTDELEKQPYPTSVGEMADEFQAIAADYSDPWLTVPRPLPRFGKPVEAAPTKDQWQRHAKVAMPRLKKLAGDLSVACRRAGLNPKCLIEYVHKWHYFYVKDEIGILLDELRAALGAGALPQVELLQPPAISTAIEQSHVPPKEVSQAAVLDGLYCLAAAVVYAIDSSRHRPQLIDQIIDRSTELSRMPIDDFHKLKEQKFDESVMAGAIALVRLTRGIEKYCLFAEGMSPFVPDLTDADSGARQTALRSIRDIATQAKIDEEINSDEYDTSALDQSPYPSTLIEKASAFKRLAQDFATIPPKFHPLYNQTIDGLPRELLNLQYAKWSAYVVVVQERLTKLCRDLSIAMKLHDLNPRPLLQYALDWKFSERKLRIEVLLSELEIADEAQRIRSAGNRSPEDQQTKECPVSIDGEKVTVMGTEVTGLGEVHRNVLLPLIKVYPEGLKLRVLNEKSGYASDANKYLKEAAEHHQILGSVIRFPGGPGRGGYRLAWPEDAA